MTHLLRLALLALTPLLLFGCYYRTVAPIPLKSAEAYPFGARNNGLVAGAEPFDTPEKSAAVAARDVSTQFTPVQLVIESAATDKFLVRRDKVKLTCSNGVTLDPVSAIAVYQVYRERAVGRALLGTGVATAPGTNDPARYDWSEKEFPPETILLPKERVGGFLYFRGRCRAFGDRAVTFTAHNLATDEATTVVIDLGRSSRGRS